MDKSPVGKQVAVRPRNLVEVPVQIVGLVADAVYSDVREPMHPTMFVPAGARSNGTLSVRTSGDPLTFASTLRKIASGAYADTRVPVGEMSALVRQQMIRERLLALLSGFFAAVALLLACIGLYGVLSYTVVQQRREIGVRMALGARAGQVVARLARDTMALVAAGAAIGLAAGFSFGRVIERLLFEVKAMDPVALLTPLTMLGVAVALAAIPPALRAARVESGGDSSQRVKPRKNTEEHRIVYVLLRFPWDLSVLFSVIPWRASVVGFCKQCCVFTRSKPWRS